VTRTRRRAIIAVWALAVLHDVFVVPHKTVST